MNVRAGRYSFFPLAAFAVVGTITFAVQKSAPYRIQTAPVNIGDGPLATDFQYLQTSRLEEAISQVDPVDENAPLAEPGDKTDRLSVQPTEQSEAQPPGVKFARQDLSSSPAIIQPAPDRAGDKRLRLSSGSQTTDRLPRITGFLNPDGFKREKWQKVGNAPVLTPAVNTHRFVVMLDPGHGGSDPGSIAQNGLMEKDLTLEIAQRVKELLSESNELEVILTRNHDHGLSRKTRVSSIRDSHADLVLSLHFNHLPQSELNVVETFYAGPGNVAESRALLAQRELKSGKKANQQIAAPNGVDISFTRESKRLAKTLHRRIFAEVSHENESVRNAGVREKTLFVLTQSYKPSALIEITCLSNVSEAQRLTTDEYRHRLATALADGIRSYHRTFHLTSLDKASDKDADVDV